MMQAFKENKIQAKDVDHWVFGGRGSVNEKIFKLFFSNLKQKIFTFEKNKRIHYVNHHVAHVSLGIYGSGFQDGTFYL